MLRTAFKRLSFNRLGIFVARNFSFQRDLVQFKRCRLKLLSFSTLPFRPITDSYVSSGFMLGGLLSFFGKKDDESELTTIIKRAILLIEKGEMKKSEQMLHVALKLAQEQQNAQGIVYILDLMANLAYEVEDYTKANKLFVSVMQHLLVAGVPQNDNKIIHISLKLADTYQKVGDTSKSEEGFQFCIANLQNKFDAGVRDEDTLLLFAMTLDWYARFVLNLGRYKEAFTLFQKAYDMSVDLNGTNSEQTVVLLNDLGTVSCLQGDYDAALRYLKQAVAVGETLPNMSDFASVYVNLGSVYIKKQMFSEAKRACTNAWENARAHKNKEAEHEADLCLEEIKRPAAV